MHPTANRILRWLTITGFGGYGISALVSGILQVFVRSEAARGVFDILLFVLIQLPSVVSIAISYLTFRRQYRQLFTLLCVITSVVVFCLIMALPDMLGLRHLLKMRSDSPWILFLELPVGLATLIMPFYGASWAYRHAQAIVARFIREETPRHTTPRRTPA